MERSIKLDGKGFDLRVKEFDEEIDIDAILTIDMTNLLGEIVNFPVYVNRLGIMLAQSEKKVAERKAALKFLEATLKDELCRDAEAGGLKAPTVVQMENHVLKHPKYRALQAVFIKETEENRILESIMWSAKDKSDKLNKLSLSIQPGDIEDAIQNRGTKRLIK